MNGADGERRRSGDVSEAVAGARTATHGASGAGPSDAQATRTRVGSGRGGGEMRMVDRERPRSYYDRPIVKRPVWSWEIPWYFFTGGLAGASSMLAYSTSLAGNRPLARRAWLVALGAISASPALLISDLGRPERFLNMLRVFKVTSPMSVGSWILSVNGAAIAPAAAGALLGRPRPLARAGRVAEPVAALAGLPLATYTAVLIANSAIPVWSEARRELPFVFAASSAASAGGAAAALTPAAHAGPARRLALAGAVGELAAVKLMESRLGRLAEPYEEPGRTKRLGAAAKALTAAGAGVMALAGRRRGAAALAGAMLLAGSVCERWSVFSAGFDSAADPSYTVETQRGRIGGAG